MKFGNTGRTITDKNKFMTNKPRGSFLDRFKGRTTQLDKEGHFGVVKSTKIPIKALNEHPNESYSNNQNFKQNSFHRQSMDTTRNANPKNNFEALSPLKRSNSITNDKMFNQGSNRYESFARNFKKNDTMMTMSHKDPNMLRTKLSNAGSNVLRNSYSNTMKNEYPKMGSSHSMNAMPQMNSSGLSFDKNKSSMTPSLNPKAAYSSMKSPVNLAASMKAPAGRNANYRKKFNMTEVKKNKPYPMPYSNNSMADNSNGFTNTAVSTPMDNLVNYIK